MCDFCGGDHETPKVTEATKKEFYQAIVQTVEACKKMEHKFVEQNNLMIKAANLKDKNTIRKCNEELKAIDETMEKLMLKQVLTMFYTPLIAPNYKEN
jgi:uncharacterized membrane protein (DUF106 family)